METGLKLFNGRIGERSARSKAGAGVLKLSGWGLGATGADGVFEARCGCFHPSSIFHPQSSSIHVSLRGFGGKAPYSGSGLPLVSGASQISPMPSRYTSVTTAPALA